VLERAGPSLALAPRSTSEGVTMHQCKRLVLVGSSTLLLGIAASLAACSGEEGTPAVESTATPATATTATGETPVFLRHTAWPVAFHVPSTFSVPGSSSQTAGAGNFLDYSFPAADTSGRKTDGKLHSFFQSCPQFPCIPENFSNEPCHFYLFRDASQGGRYMAYTYSEPNHQYVVFADGLGPLYPDFLQRYYTVNPVPPQSQPPSGTVLVAGNPEHGKVLWFRAAGFGGFPETEDVFAVYDHPDRTAQGSYRPPYAFGGKHGQAVYGKWNLHPDFGPATFQPPAGYEKAPLQKVTYHVAGHEITLDCPMRFPFDLWDNPVKEQDGKLEPLRESIMVCTACHASDALEDSPR
jgi:hypothetical protein